MWCNMFLFFIITYSNYGIILLGEKSEKAVFKTSYIVYFVL